MEECFGTTQNGIKKVNKILPIKINLLYYIKEEKL